jgi:5'-3' exonuclease
VAPRAKMNQQRIRRFRGIKEKAELREIRERFKQPHPVEWDTNAITPGTEFMINLSEKINNYIKKSKVKITFSDWTEPMEGEHKIIRFIQEYQKEHPDESHVIYGLDADLIMLSLLLSNPNIYLLREKIYFREDLKKQSQDGQPEFCYLYISRMKKYLETQFEKRDPARIVNDFVVLAFFIGNDFIPHIYSINIKQKGLDTLIHYYRETLQQSNGYLLNLDYSLNMNFMIQFMNYLSETEDDLIRDYEDSMRHFKPRLTGEAYQDFLESRNLIKDKYNREYSISDPNFRNKFYEYHFGKGYNIDQICEEYFRAIKWTTEYYFRGIPSWSWFYPYTQAPLLKELNRYLSKLNWEKIKFDKSEPLTPVQQLLAVLPPQSEHLIPVEYRKLMKLGSPIEDFYPVDFGYSMQGKIFLYECHPILPWIDINRLKKYVK